MPDERNPDSIRPAAWQILLALLAMTAGMFAGGFGAPWFVSQFIRVTPHGDGLLATLFAQFAGAIVGCFFAGRLAWKLMGFKGGKVDP